jgi:Mn2+/Fe2+ NRAMP family transporter
MALAPIAGDAAGIIFALGILGTGLLAVPVLAGSTAYAVSEAMGWRESLERKPSQAKQFYAVIAISMVIAVALNLMGINPMRSLVVAALLNGLTAPILMFIIWWLARDKQLLGEHASPWWSSLLVAIGAIAMAALADPLVIRARVGLCDYFELVSFQANGRTAPAATALIASPIKNGTTPFAIAQAIVLPVV